MKPSILLATEPQRPSQFACPTVSPAARSTTPPPQPQLTPIGSAPGEFVRHILLGSPGAIQQTIHRLHTLHYSETILWTPVLSIEEQLIITPAQSEAISLLRKQI